MTLLRVIPVYAAAAALILVPVLPVAQAQQADTSNKTEQNAKKKKPKKTEEQNAEPAGANERGKDASTAGKSKVKTAGSAQRAVAPIASDAEIAAAKSSGKVWVNTESGVYHKGGKWYGATKEGKFMTESDAVKAGFRASKNKEQ